MLLFGHAMLMFNGGDGWVAERSVSVNRACKAVFNGQCASRVPVGSAPDRGGRHQPRRPQQQQRQRAPRQRSQQRRLSPPQSRCKDSSSRSHGLRLRRPRTHHQPCGGAG